MVREGVVAMTPWRRKLYGYLALARISNSPTVVSNALTGAALAGVRELHSNLWLLALAFVLFYTAGMYLNDLCDYAIDRRDRPERPLPSGLVPRTHAVVITFGLFVSAGAILWTIHTTAFLSGLILIVLIVLYDLWHKTNPLSPLLMASTRCMVYVTAYLAFATSPSSQLVIWSLLLALYIVSLTFLAKQEHRQSIIRHWPVALLLLPAGYGFATAPTLLLLPIVLIFITWVVYSRSLIYRAPPRIGAAIGQLIAGISLLDALVLATLGWHIGLALALGAWVTTLVLQRYVKGT